MTEIEKSIFEFNKKFENIFSQYKNLTNIIEFRKLLNELFPNIYSHLNENIDERASRHLLRDEINRFLYKHKLPIPNRDVQFLPKKLKSMDKEIVLYYLLETMKRICINKNIQQLYTIFPNYNKKMMKEDYFAQKILR